MAFTCLVLNGALKKELERNLKAEQPNADWFQHPDKYTQDKVGRFCIGYNTSREDLFQTGSAVIHVDGKGVIDDVTEWLDRLPNKLLYSAKGTIAETV